MKRLLTASSCSESSKLLLQVLLVVLLMVPISPSRQPRLHKLWSGQASEKPLCTCCRSTALLQGRAGLQKHFLRAGLIAYIRGGGGRGCSVSGFLALYKFACTSVQVMKYFLTDQLLTKCWGFSICAVLANSRSICFEMVYGEKIR